MRHGEVPWAGRVHEDVVAAHRAAQRPPGRFQFVDEVSGLQGGSITTVFRTSTLYLPIEARTASVKPDQESFIDRYRAPATSFLLGSLQCWSYQPGQIALSFCSPRIIQRPSGGSVSTLFGSGTNSRHACPGRLAAHHSPPRPPGIGRVSTMSGEPGLPTTSTFSNSSATGVAQMCSGT